MKSFYRFIPLCMLLLFSTITVSASKQPLPLMPWPQEVIEQQGRLNVNPRSVQIRVDGDELSSNLLRWYERIGRQTGTQVISLPDDDSLKIEIQINKVVDAIPQLGIDESYSVSVSQAGVLLRAETRFGAMRGMETVLQLFQHDDQSFYLPYIEIKDAPRFMWRGLLLDSARHFLPMETIKRQIDGIAASKMNVFHWHLTDDQGWRFESLQYPKLQEMASDGLYYTHDQMKEVVAYAATQGIRVIPEIDLPGHASAIAIAYPELMSAQEKYQMERQWGVHKPTLDPTNAETYTFIEGIISEVVEIFPDLYIHIGGDEVEGSQWKNSITIQSFMEKNSITDIAELQAYFNGRVEKILEKYRRQLIGWDEIYHKSLPTTSLIQSWRGQDALGKVAQEGYFGILSTGFYVDQPQSTEYHYNNRILPESIVMNDVVLAGEQIQSWSFTMPRLKGSAVTGSLSLIRGNEGWRGFIDFAERSRMVVQNVQWSNEQAVSFSVDTWMGTVTPVVTFDAKINQMKGYFIVGNVRYPITGEKLESTPVGIMAVIPDAEKMSNILGAEATLWAENVTADIVDIKLWPRIFAIGERLWSPAEVKDVENMYQRLERVNVWSIISVGLQHQMQADQILMRLSNSTNIEPLKILAEAVEPAHYYSRHHAKFVAGNYHQFEPLNRFVDALSPESMVVLDIDKLVTRFILDRSDQGAYQALMIYFQRWQKNQEKLEELVDQNILLSDLIPIINGVGKIATLGINLLDSWKNNAPYSIADATLAQQMLDQNAEMQNEMVIRAVYPLEQLLDAVGVQDESQ